ncbi:MAG: hypothetical protein ABSC05_34375 [Candidatus Solibacter sp.]
MKSPWTRAQTASQEEAEILEIARREASPDHVLEFEPITRGPLFAVCALAPLGVIAAFCLVWQKLRGLGS